MYALGQQRTTVGDTVRFLAPLSTGPVLPYSLSRIRYEHAHLHPADRQRRFGTQVVSKSRCPGPRAAQRGCIPSMPRGSSGSSEVEWSRHGAHAKTRQTRIHHDRRPGAPCQATQGVYPYLGRLPPGIRSKPGSQAPNNKRGVTAYRCKLGNGRKNNYRFFYINE